MGKKFLVMDPWIFFIELKEKRKVGGERGGGSEITEEARELMTKFKLFREETDQSLNSLYKKIFK